VIIVAGEGRLSSHPLVAPLVIGRDPGCDIVIADRAFSRRHARVRPGPPVTVEDLGSTNGTRLGATVLVGGEVVRLEPGDSFHIGAYSFMLTARGAGEERSATGGELLRILDPTVDGAAAIVREVAAAGVNVLVLGETGAGKEVLAETLHVLSRRAGRLVRVNCAALAEPLLEAELFGHEKGAYTGAGAAREGLIEAADGGTLFLDEIGELPLDVQAKLLRVVERREVTRVGSTRAIPVDVRFVAATNRDLPAEVAAGSFRADLFFRLDGVTLSIPPLRERGEQIGALALRFLAEAYRRAGKPPQPLPTEVLALLEAHPWPGNVRELRTVVERAVLLSRGGPLAPRHFVFSAPAPAAAPAGDAASPAEAAERARIVQALEQCGGNQTRAAKLLGVSRATLVNKLRFHRIRRPRG
jgi:transcriptional regulator with PAS, ATPase and Fis domain